MFSFTDIRLSEGVNKWVVSIAQRFTNTGLSGLLLRTSPSAVLPLLFLSPLHIRKIALVTGAT